MELDMWLFKNKISKTEFAKTIHVNRAYLHHLLSGLAIPSRDLAKKIYRITGAKVKMKTHKKIEDWDK